MERVGISDTRVFIYIYGTDICNNDYRLSQYQVSINRDQQRLTSISATNYTVCRIYDAVYVHLFISNILDELRQQPIIRVI